MDEINLDAIRAALEDLQRMLDQMDVERLKKAGEPEAAPEAEPKPFEGKESPGEESAEMAAPAEEEDEDKKRLRALAGK